MATSSRVLNNIWEYSRYQLIIWGISFLFLLVIAVGMFMPVIRKARKERETSLQAFLQIPKDVTQVLFQKYYDPEHVSRDDLAVVDDKSDIDTSDDESIIEKGDGLSNISSLKLSAQTGYTKLTSWYIKAIFVIAIAFSTALTANYLILRRVDAVPGTLALSGNILYRASRIGLTVQEKVSWPNSTTFPMNDTQRPWAQFSNVMQWDIQNVTEFQVSLLYGDPRFGVPFAPLENEYTSLLFGDMYQRASSARGAYDAFHRFLDQSALISRMPTIDPNDTRVIEVLRVSPLISTNIKAFMGVYLRDIDHKIYVVR
ncbi:hypothetical protein HDV05_002461, partial [Chytridiales sp. JEL 0842]